FWNLNIPSKIRIHLWKVANGFVPKLCTLKPHKLVVNMLCLVYKAEEETMNHLFRDIIFTKQVLREIGVVFSTTNMENNWKQWLAVEFVNSSRIMSRNIAISFGALWYNCNKIYHEGIRERCKKQWGL
ncbi:hypothetical protein J1N35_018872, partial [Gossypium stocksii]